MDEQSVSKEQKVLYSSCFFKRSRGTSRRAFTPPPPPPPVASRFSLQFTRGHKTVPDVVDGPSLNSVPCATVLSFWLSSISVRVDKIC